MAQLHGVSYITTDEDRVPASDFRDDGREPENAEEVMVEFDCPICEDEQVGHFPAPLSENQLHQCNGQCEETYYLHPMTAISSGKSTFTMTIEELIETQLRSIEKFYPIDRSVGIVGVEMLEEVKIAIIGSLSLALAFMGVLFYATTMDITTTVNSQSVSFMFITASIGMGAFALVQGAISPVFRGYVAYRNVRGRVDYSFTTFMRHAANYHHQKPF